MANPAATPQSRLFRLSDYRTSDPGLRCPRCGKTLCVPARFQRGSGARRARVAAVVAWVPLQLSLAAVAFCVWPWWSSAWFNIGPIRSWLNGRACCEFCGFALPGEAEGEVPVGGGATPCAVLPLRRAGGRRRRHT